jgi:transcriptional regulator with XRE-family HTH domain
MNTQSFLDEHKISQTELGSALMLDGSSISRKLSGQRSWTGSQIIRALAFFTERLGRPVTFEEAFGSTSSGPESEEPVSEAPTDNPEVKGLEGGREGAAADKSVQCTADTGAQLNEGDEVVMELEDGTRITATVSEVRKEEAA